MYIPRYGMNYIAQQTATARQDAASRAKSQAAQSVGHGAPGRARDGEVGALWRMLSVVVVAGVIAGGFALAVWVGGL